jgi:CheY-like chemotaxis protein
MLKKILSGFFKAELDAIQKKHETELLDLHAQAEKSLSEITFLQNENQKTAEKLVHAEQANQTLKQQIALLESQLAEQQKSSQFQSELGPQLEILKTEKAELETQLSQFQSVNAGLTQNQHALQQALDEVKLLKEEVTAYQQQKGFLQGQLRQLETEKTEQAKVFQEKIKMLETRLKSDAPATPHKGEVSQESHRQQKLVLIVDDALTTRVLQKNMLESAGFQVIMAKDGLEGQAMCEQNHPDLVITDVEMPKMDGFELTRWIKQSAFRDVPVLMVTSHADPEFQQKGREAGADDFVVKTNFNQKTFVEIVGRHV